MPSSRGAPRLRLSPPTRPAVALAHETTAWSCLACSTWQGPQRRAPPEVHWGRPVPAPAGRRVRVKEEPDGLPLPVGHARRHLPAAPPRRRRRPGAAGDRRGGRGGLSRGLLIAKRKGRRGGEAEKKPHTGCFVRLWSATKQPLRGTGFQISLRRNTSKVASLVGWFPSALRKEGEWSRGAREAAQALRVYVCGVVRVTATRGGLPAPGKAGLEPCWFLTASSAGYWFSWCDGRNVDTSVCIL